MATKANIKGDLWELLIGGTSGPFEVSISLADLLDIVPIRSARTGTTTITELIQGHGGTITVEAQEVVVAEIKRALGIASGDAPLDVGNQMPTHAVTLHNPLDGATTTSDIHFFACVFANFRRTSDGQGPATFQFDLRAQADANGDVWRIDRPS